mgnify:CR=1 FL=1|tara:strand:- start:225 stop:611 length:387 start_codon:yes stop_codon:yes gene_type:complete
MICFRKHIPSFVDVREPIPDQEFVTLQDLLGSLKKDVPGRTFHRWSRDGDYIMGEWDGGLDWWVMGRSDSDLSSLPQWEPVYLALIDGEETRLTGADIRSSCGDYLTLSDGRVVPDATRVKTSTKDDG